MPAFLEPNPLMRRSYILRGGADATEYSKDYHWSGTVQACWRWPWSKKRIAEVKGFSRTEDDRMSEKEIFFAIQDCLNAAGFTHFKWDRLSEGKKRPFMYPTARRS